MIEATKTKSSDYFLYNTSTVNYLAMLFICRHVKLKTDVRLTAQSEIKRLKEMFYFSKKEKKKERHLYIE